MKWSKKAYSAGSPLTLEIIKNATDKIIFFDLQKYFKDCVVVESEIFIRHGWKRNKNGFGWYWSVK